MLSRDNLPVTSSPDDDIEAQVNTMILPVSSAKLEEFKKETRSDVIVTKRTETVLDRTTSCKIHSVILELQGTDFSSGWSSVQRTAAHRSCGAESRKLKHTHDGHLFIKRCRRRAREVLFWPGNHRVSLRCEQL